MRHLKNETGSIIIKWNENAGTATITEALLNDAPKGILVKSEVVFGDVEAFTEIDVSEYDEIRNNIMLPYWNETAS